MQNLKISPKKFVVIFLFISALISILFITVIAIKNRSYTGIVEINISDVLIENDVNSQKILESISCYRCLETSTFYIEVNDKKNNQQIDERYLTEILLNSQVAGVGKIFLSSKSNDPSLLRIHLELAKNILIKHINTKEDGIIQNRALELQRITKEQKIIPRIFDESVKNLTSEDKLLQYVYLIKTTERLQALEEKKINLEKKIKDYKNKKTNSTDAIKIISPSKFNNIIGFIISMLITSAIISYFFCQKNFFRG